MNESDYERLHKCCDFLQGAILACCHNPAPHLARLQELEDFVWKHHREFQQTEFQKNCKHEVCNIVRGNTVCTQCGLTLPIGPKPICKHWNKNTDGTCKNCGEQTMLPLSSTCNHVFDVETGLCSCGASPHVANWNDPQPIESSGLPTHTVCPVSSWGHNFDVNGCCTYCGYKKT